MEWYRLHSVGSLYELSPNNVEELKKKTPQWKGKKKIKYL